MNNYHEYHFYPHHNLPLARAVFKDFFRKAVAGGIYFRNLTADALKQHRAFPQSVQRGVD